MADRPSNTELKKCVICQREQEWRSDLGCVSTKGWHGVEISKDDWGKRLKLSYPAKDSRQIVCSDCIPVIAGRYMEMQSFGDGLIR
jgi:hypothetical protein